MLSDLVRRKGYKVVLTGEGSDEIFGGYSWHLPDALLEADPSRPDFPLQQNEALRKELLAKVTKSYAAFSKLAIGGDEHVEDSSLRSLNYTFAPIGNNLMQPAGQLFKRVLRERYTLADRIEMQRSEWSETTRDKIANEWHPLHTSLYRLVLTNSCLECPTQAPD